MKFNSRIKNNRDEYYGTMIYVTYPFTKGW